MYKLKRGYGIPKNKITIRLNKIIKVGNLSKIILSYLKTKSSRWVYDNYYNKWVRIL